MATQEQLSINWSSNLQSGEPTTKLVIELTVATALPDEAIDSEIVADFIAGDAKRVIQRALRARKRSHGEA